MIKIHPTVFSIQNNKKYFIAEISKTKYVSGLLTSEDTPVSIQYIHPPPHPHPPPMVT